MLVNEVRLVSVEAVGNEDGNIILPSVARGCREKYPLVGLGDFQECFCPCAISDNSLLVKYKECIFDVLILGNIVPRINDHRVLVVVGFRMHRQQEWSHFLAPLTFIPLFCCCDDVEISRLFHDAVSFIEISALLLVIVGEASPRFARTDPAAEDTAIVHFCEGFSLVVVEADTSHN